VPFGAFFLIELTVK